MKHVFAKFFILFLCCSFSTVNAGTPFEGSMAVTFSSGGKAQEVQKFELTTKNNQVLVDAKMKDVPRVLLNNATGALNLIMDGQGQKMAIKLNLASINKIGGLSTLMGKSYGFSEKSTTIKATTETKEINGVKCVKYTAKDASYSTTFWVTKDVDFDFVGILGIADKFPELKEMMLIKASGKNLKTGETFSIDVKPTAKKVDEGIFKVPAGYQVMDMSSVIEQMMKTQKPEEIKKMLLQMMNKK